MEEKEIFDRIIKQYNDFNIEIVERETNLYFIKKYVLQGTKGWTAMLMEQNSTLRRIYNTLKYGINKNINYSSNNKKYEKSLEKYSPTSSGDAEKIYYINSDYLDNQVDDFINKMLAKEQSTLKLSEMNYISFTLQINGQDMYLIGKVDKINRINDGFVAKMKGNKIELTENDKFGISENFGMIIYQDIVYIFNKNFFENFFNLDEKFQAETQNHVMNLMKSNHFIGLEDYLVKVQNNKRYTRRISKALDKFKEESIDFNKISKKEFKKRMNEISKNVEDLKMNKDGKVEFKDDSDLESVTKLITDDYFITILSQTFGSSE